MSNDYQDPREFKPTDETMQRFMVSVTASLKELNLPASLPYLKAFLCGMRYINSRNVSDTVAGRSERIQGLEHSVYLGAIATVLMEKIVAERSAEVAKRVDTITGEQNPPL